MPTSLSHQPTDVPFKVKTFAEKAKTEGTPEFLAMENLITEQAEESAALHKLEAIRCIEMTEKLNKEKDLMVEAQREKAKLEEQEQFRRDELDMLRAEKEQKLTSGDSSILAQLGKDTKDEISQLETKNKELDKQLAQSEKNLTKASDDYNQRRDDKVADLKDDLKQKVKSKEFKVYNYEGKEFDITDDFVDKLVDVAVKPLSTKLPKVNPGHTKQVGEALEEEEKQNKEKVKKGEKPIAPEKSVAAAVNNQKTLFGQIEAFGLLAELLGQRDVNIFQLKGLIKYNPHINKLMQDIQDSTSKEDLQNIKDFYNSGHAYVQQSEQRSQNLDKIDILKGVQKRVDKNLPRPEPK